MTVDLHASQEQGFFNGPVDHLTAMPVLLDYVRDSMALDNATMVSPDAGRIKVSEQWAAKLGGLPLSFIHKTRDITRPNHAEAHGIIGDVDGRDCIVVDDMIDTAGTICEAVKTLQGAGAKSITLVATHGLLSGPAIDRLKNADVREIVLTDTVPIPQEKRLPNMTVLSIAPLLAAGIRSVFESGSVSTLMNGLPTDIRPRNIYA
jgi:ribose-phosphate pyrophosphokinase